MRAARVVALDGPDGVRVGEIGPAPVAGEDEVLIEVHSVGLSYPDLLMSQGRYQIKPEVPFVLGVDFAGVVSQDAPALGFAAGDQVAGWSTYGSAAEVVAVPPERVFPLPKSLNFDQGAAMPLNYLTAHFALAVRARVRPGAVVVVNGAAGGVGSAAVQIAAGLGCRVIGMVSSAEEAAFATAMGADETIEGANAERVRDLTGGLGADVVLDVIGSDQVVLESLRSLAIGGRLLSLGYVAGEIPSVRLNRLLLANIDVSGVAWGPWTRAHPGFARQQWEELMPLVDSGAVRPDVRQIVPVEDIAAAMRAMLDRKSLGKTVLRFA